MAGRGRWLSLLALPLAAMTLGAALATDLGIPLRGPVGDRTVTVTTVEQLSEPITLGAGELTVDLRQLDEAPDGPVEVSVGAGDLTVLLPEDAGISGRARAEVGQVHVLGERSDGVGVARTIDEPAGPDEPTFDLSLTVGAGRIDVRAEAADTREPATTTIPWSDR